MFKNVKRHLAYWTESSEEPAIGSVIFCKLVGNAEHTGIFIGHLGEYDKCIVELGGDGEIRLVTPQKFLEGPSGLRLSGIAIYSSCDESGNPIGNYQVADRAKNMIGTTRNYNVAMDNCHQFSCGCLSGNFENSNNFFWMMEDEVKKYLNNDRDITWRSWEFENNNTSNKNIYRDTPEDILNAYGNINIDFPTAGGHICWDNLDSYSGWTLQENSFTGHCRILDVEDYRKAWGDRNEMISLFNRLKKVL